MLPQVLLVLGRQFVLNTVLEMLELGLQAEEQNQWQNHLSGGRGGDRKLENWWSNEGRREEKMMRGEESGP